MHKRAVTVAGAVTLRPVSEPRTRDWATTAEVCEAGGIATSTAFNWSSKGLLPAYTTIAGGRRGRSSRWPMHAPEQARWVARMLAQGFTVAEVQEALAGGEFKATIR